MPGPIDFPRDVPPTANTAHAHAQPVSFRLNEALVTVERDGRVGIVLAESLFDPDCPGVSLDAADAFLLGQALIQAAKLQGVGR